MTCSVITSSRIGRRLGIVILVNGCHLFAPSIEAAS